jgi:hypothetical protein
MQAFPRGSPRFPRPTIPRVQSPQFSPPSHLDAREVGFPRRFHVSPRESVPPLERWGTSSPHLVSQQEAATLGATLAISFLRRGELRAERVLLPLASPLSPIPSPISPLRRVAFNFQIWSGQSPAPPVKTTAGGRSRLPRPTSQVCPSCFSPSPLVFLPTSDDGPTVVLISYIFGSCSCGGEETTVCGGIRRDRSLSMFFKLHLLVQAS